MKPHSDRLRLCFITCCALAFIAGCKSTTQVLTGTPRAAIPVSQVVVYAAPPPQFEDVAVLSASSKSVFGSGGQAAVDKVVERLKAQAAQLGANGLVLEDFSDRQTASIGSGFGSESYTHNAGVGVGVGGAVGVFKKTGKARAIYVPPAN